MQSLPYIKHARSEYATTHYLGDKYIYIVGGEGKHRTLVSECEKFHIKKQKWFSLGHLNEKRLRPKSTKI